MKMHKIIEKYPITVIFIFAATIYFTWRIMLSLFIAALIIFPIYLAVQIFNDK
tara:strand:- start:182 stop:340 length:159 start_codon:yes stop_codon:yes gene_type:complete